MSQNLDQTAPPVEGDTIAELVEAEIVPTEPSADERIAQLEDKYLRSVAELDNYRKRVTRERLELIQSANAGLLEDLLPVIDNFRFGLDAARQEGETSVVFVGMNMVRLQLEKFLSENGIAEIKAEGSAFDPKIHDAVSQQETTDIPEGQVLQVTRAGYLLRNKLLRPASVIVAAKPASDQP